MLPKDVFCHFRSFISCWSCFSSLWFYLVDAVEAWSHDIGALGRTSLQWRITSTRWQHSCPNDLGHVSQPKTISVNQRPIAVYRNCNKSFATKSFGPYTLVWSKFGLKWWQSVLPPDIDIWCKPIKTLKTHEGPTCPADVFVKRNRKKLNSTFSQTHSKDPRLILCVRGRERTESVRDLELWVLLHWIKSHRKLHWQLTLAAEFCTASSHCVVFTERTQR